MRVESENETLTALEALEAKVDGIAAEIAAIRRHFLWERVWSTVRFLLIAAPTVWAVLTYGPAVLKLYGQLEGVIRQAQSILPR